jgi:hypothetical protein
MECGEGLSWDAAVMDATVERRRDGHGFLEAATMTSTAVSWAF